MTAEHIKQLFWQHCEPYEEYLKDGSYRQSLVMTEKGFGVALNKAIDEACKKQSLEITSMLDKMIDNFETTPTDKPIIRGIELTLAKLIKMNIEIQFLSSPKETLPSIKQDKLLTDLSPILLLPELPKLKDALK